MEIYDDAGFGAICLLYALRAGAEGGLIAGILLYTRAPNAAGSGIPQTKVAYYRDFGIIKLKEGMYRFLLGCVFVGFGGSLGREGPRGQQCTCVPRSLQA